ncbi:hypothetical protein [Streptomyces sp. NPDC002088]|uniref:hypothetical protein n=1 Tax=Streptomyces sp. NPDC002088 TaxID=3154665 RepID=UPI003326F3C8
MVARQHIATGPIQQRMVIVTASRRGLFPPQRDVSGEGGEEKTGAVSGHEPANVIGAVACGAEPESGNEHEESGTR